MAAEVKSGAANASYVNNTTQNVRLIINYMSRVTSMTWAGVNVTASATTIGKDIQNITGELRQAVKGTKIRDFIGPDAGVTPNELVGTLYNAEIASSKSGLLETDDTTIAGTGGVSYLPSATSGFPERSTSIAPNAINTFYDDFNAIGPSTVELPNLFYVPLTISRGGNFPVELMLASGQSFSAVCGAFNFVAIREDGN
jgi:hypothetical protein